MSSTSLAHAKCAIADIVVGERHRRDLGNIDSLAASIADVGMLHPVVITPDATLIAGGRRLETARALGWSKVPVWIVDLDDIERGEIAENTERKDFLPSEIDAIRRKHEAKLKAAAKERMSAAGKGAKVSQPLRTTDKIGAFAGVSGRTVEKIAAVVEAAEAEPERFGKLLDDMDRTGRVNGPYRRPPWSPSAPGSLAQGKSTTAPAEAFDVVTNPPFRLARAFVERAVTLGARKTAVIFPTARLNAARWLEPLPLAKIYLLTPRPSIPPGEVIARGERPGGGRVDFAWLVFNHGHSAPPELRWLHRDRSGT